MDQSINEIKHFFHNARNQASARIKPFVNEMEHISLERARETIDDAKANFKMRQCCAKHGINPSVIDGAYFEAQSIKMSSIGSTPFDYDQKKPGRQNFPKFKFGGLGADFNNKKPGRQTRPQINLPKMDFKPVDLFKQTSQPKAPRQVKNSNPFMGFPNFNIKMPLQENKKHQGRFEAVDLLPGPKGSHEAFIMPVAFGKPRKSNKTKKPKNLINIKPIKFGGLF